MTVDAKAVLDASALLTLLLKEKGAANLTDEIMIRSVVSAINLAEVQTKLVSRGYDPEEAWEDAVSLTREVKSFTAAHAKTAGTLVSKTQHRGLSLGDRSCLALAIELKAEVFTTEKSWKQLKIGVPIHLLR